MSTQNGTGVQVEGASGLTFVTLPDSGHTIPMRRIAPHTADALRAAVERERAASKPQPPTVRLEVGPGTYSEEPDTSNAAYQADLALWKQDADEELSRRLMRLIAARSAITVDQEALTDLRESMHLVGSPLDEGSVDELLAQGRATSREQAQLVIDRETYLYHILCVSEADLAALMSHVLRATGPSEEAIRRHQDAFRGQVPPA